MAAMSPTLPEAPSCRKCGSTEVRSMIVKPEIVYWWCAKCGAIFGHSLEQKPPPKD